MSDDVLVEKPDIAELIKRERPNLVAFAARLAGSKHRGEDVVQDSLVRAWRAWARWVPTGDPLTYARAWLFRIVVNTYINSYQQARLHSRTVRTLLAEYHVHIQDFVAIVDPDRGNMERADAAIGVFQDPMEGLNHEQLKERIEEALSLIRPEFRETVVRYYLLEQPTSQIARELRVKLDTVGTRLIRARRLLKPLLELSAKEHCGMLLGRAGQDAPSLQAPKDEQTEADRVEGVVANDDV